MQLLDVIKENRNYRELYPGEYAGPCPTCGGALRLRIWPARETFKCINCTLEGGAAELAAILNPQKALQAPAAICEPQTENLEPRTSNLEPEVHTITAKDGRRVHITDNRTEYDRLTAQGLIVFDSQEMKLVKLSGADQDQAACYLDAKQTFPGIRITAVCPDRIAESAPTYRGKYTTSKEA